MYSPDLKTANDHLPLSVKPVCIFKLYVVDIRRQYQYTSAVLVPLYSNMEMNKNKKKKNSPQKKIYNNNEKQHTTSRAAYKASCEIP